MLDYQDRVDRLEEKLERMAEKYIREMNRHEHLYAAVIALVPLTFLLLVIAIAYIVS